MSGGGGNQGKCGQHGEGGNKGRAGKGGGLNRFYRGSGCHGLLGGRWKELDTADPREVTLGVDTGAHTGAVCLRFLFLSQINGAYTAGHYLPPAGITSQSPADAADIEQSVKPPAGGGGQADDRPRRDAV